MGKYSYWTGKSDDRHKREMEIQRDGETDMQACRRADMQTCRQTDTQTEGERNT